MFKNDIKQIAFNKNDIVIALPIISKILIIYIQKRLHYLIVFIQFNPDH